MIFGTGFKRMVKYIQGTYALYNLLSSASGNQSVPRYYLHRDNPPKIDFDELQREFAHNPLSKEKDTFVLYRIIGNDLVPRHKKGQSRDNLKFILDNEPELAQCTKRFVVNRIVDSKEEEAVISLLQSAGYGYLHLPFQWEAYQAVQWDIEGVPSEYAPYTSRFARLSRAEQERLLMRLYRHKNNYVMHNNGARNAALTEGKQLAKWVLPFDGNCFVTARAWETISAEVASRPFIPHFIVPMSRVTNNSLLLRHTFCQESREEPQVIFRKDSHVVFNQDFFYGRRPKVELLWRLGVPGKWDEWYFEPWDLPRPKYSDQAGRFAWSGWVARLDSGQTDLEGGSGQCLVNRGLARNKAISGLLDRLDEQILSGQDFCLPLIIASPALPQGHMQPARDHLAGSLLASAEQALSRGPYSVIDKSTLPPSGDVHDYWHPAPYYWPNPLTPSGRPYISRDGRRVPGTRLYEPESDKYDRTRLQRLFDDTFILTMAWHYHGDRRFAHHAAELVRTWFLQPGTAMNPRLAYAQVRPGHNNDLGSSSGIIEMKDLYYFLDAVRILQCAGVFTSREQLALQKWFREYLNWLRTSPQGQKERSSSNNHGVYYDLQVASVAAFVGEALIVRDTFRDSRFRIVHHFNAQGWQPEEMKRTMTAHYCCFNLQGWIHLAKLAEACGEDLWGFTGDDGRGIRTGLLWLLSHLGQEWPYEQIETFDQQRLYPIYYACWAKYGITNGKEEDVVVPAPHDIKPLFYPHDGIRPFWQLGISRQGLVVAKDGEEETRGATRVMA